MQSDWVVGDSLTIGSCSSFRGWVNVDPADVNLKINWVNVLAQFNGIYMLAICKNQQVVECAAN